jgi:hypothetical protein
VKPFWGVIVIVLLPLEPCVRLRLFGDAEMLKFGTALTVRVIVVMFVRLPDVPVTVTVAVPRVAVLLAESDSVLVVEVLVGARVAVTPAGNPDTDKLTLPEKAPTGATVIVLVPFAPCNTVRALGAAERLNPEMGVTPGQLLTKLVAFKLPMPVAKSQPVVVPYAGAKELLEVERTPTVPEGK